MYLEYFGLRSAPFEERADTQFLYKTPEIEQMLASLEHELFRGLGTQVLTGLPGTGKTLLLRSLILRCSAKEQMVVVTCTSNQPSNLIRETCKGFGVVLPARDKPERTLSRLKRHLAGVKRSGLQPILIVDQADNLDDTSMKELAVLSGLSDEGKSLLTILLVGQPKLLNILDGVDGEPIHQKIIGKHTTALLGREQSGAFIHHRLRIAGAGQANLFDESAIEMIHRAAKGNPRQINHLCNAGLSTAAAQGIRQLTGELLLDTWRCLGMIDETVQLSEAFIVARDRPTVVAQAQSSRAQIPDTQTINQPIEKQSATMTQKEQTIMQENREDSGISHRLATVNTPTNPTDDRSPPTAPHGAIAQGGGAYALDHPFTTLSDSAHKLASRLEGAIEEATHSVGRVEARIDAAIADVENRLVAIANRAEDVSRETQNKLQRLEDSCRRADHLERNLTQWVEDFTGKTEKLNQGISRLSRTIEAGDQRERVLSETVRQASEIADTVDDRLTRQQRKLTELEKEWKQSIRELENKLSNTIEGTRILDIIEQAGSAQKMLTSQLGEIHRLKADFEDSKVEDFVHAATHLREEVRGTCNTAQEIQCSLMTLIEKSQTAAPNLQKICGQSDIAHDRLQTTLSEVGKVINKFEVVRQDTRKAQGAANQLRGTNEDAESLSVHLTNLIAQAGNARETIKEALSQALSDVSEQINGKFGQIDDRFEQTNDKFKQVGDRFEQTNDKFKQVGGRFEQINGKFGQVDDRFKQINSQFGQTDDRFTQMEHLADVKREKIQEIEQRVDQLATAVSEVEQRAQETLSTTRNTCNTLKSLVDHAEGMVLPELQTAQEHVAALQHQLNASIVDAGKAGHRLTTAREQAIRAEEIGITLKERYTEAVRTAQTLGKAIEQATRSQKIASTILHAVDDKTARLDSHHAAATSTIENLREMSEQVIQVIEQANAVSDQSVETVHALSAQIDERMVKMQSLAQVAESGSQHLDDQIHQAYALIEEVSDVRAPLQAALQDIQKATADADRMRADLSKGRNRTRKLVEQASEQVESLDQRFQKIEHVSNRFQETLNNAADTEHRLQSAQMTATEQAGFLAEQADALNKQASSLEHLGRSAAAFHEEQTRTLQEAQKVIEHLGQQIELARNTGASGERLIQDYLVRAEQIDKKLQNLSQQSTRIGNTLERALARPDELVAAAQQQAAELERVCTAVRKVFAGLSKASLRAIDQTKGFDKASKEAHRRMQGLTHETQRAAEMLRMWVEEAGRAQQRLAGLLNQCPTLEQTQATNVLQSVSKLAGEISGATSPIDVTRKPTTQQESQEHQDFEEYQDFADDRDFAKQQEFVPANTHLPSREQEVAGIIEEMSKSSESLTGTRE